MVKRIFISYRRSDTSEFCERLYSALTGWLGDHSVFRDQDSIGVGTDFRQAMSQDLESADLVIVLIGKRWLEVKNSNGDRRLDDPRDFVRIEIELAIKFEIPIIVVLVEGATKPNIECVPDSIKALETSFSIEFDGQKDFHSEFSLLQQLIGRIEATSKKRDQVPGRLRGASHVRSALYSWIGLFVAAFLGIGSIAIFHWTNNDSLFTILLAPCLIGGLVSGLQRGIWAFFLGVAVWWFGGFLVLISGIMVIAALTVSGIVEDSPPQNQVAIGLSYWVFGSMWSGWITGWAIARAKRRRIAGLSSVLFGFIGLCLAYFVTLLCGQLAYEPGAWPMVGLIAVFGCVIGTKLGQMLLIGAND